MSVAACPAHGRTLPLGKGLLWEGAVWGPCRRGGAEPATRSRGARQVLACLLCWWDLACPSLWASNLLLSFYRKTERGRCTL